MAAKQERTRALSPSQTARTLTHGYNIREEEHKAGEQANTNLMVASADWTFMPRRSIRNPATREADREIPHWQCTRTFPKEDMHEKVSVCVNEGLITIGM